jgi:hypothetical protein
MEPAKHHKLLISKLEAVARGRIDRLMVLMPPGSAKSKYSSELFPAYYFCRKPDAAVIAVSHTAELAERFGRKVRNLIASNADTLNYGIAPDNKAAGRWETTDGGEYFAAGVGGSVTGRRADLAIIDDPVASRADAESETVRESTWAWYTNDLYTRLKPGAAIILIMTRWHLDDLGGRLLLEMANGGDQWNVLCLPALANSPHDALGRKAGEPLWPEWEDAEALERKRNAIGARDFGALFQQDPKPAGASYFNESDLLVLGKPVEYPKTCDRVFAVIDSAVKDGKDHDGTAVTYWAKSEHIGIKLICLDWDIISIQGALLERWIPSVFQRLEELAKLCGARMGSAGAFIEDAQSGQILLQQCAMRKLPARALPSNLTAAGKDGRAINAATSVFGGCLKISRHAYEKTATFKGQTQNHLMVQVTQFQIGDKHAAKRADDLLDTVTYAAGIGLGNKEGIIS